MKITDRRPMAQAVNEIGQHSSPSWNAKIWRARPMA